MPSDIIGTQIYEAATNSFVTQLGPVHTNIVLLDEINRSSAKTQSAMLEAMEERQTTIAGVEYPIPEPFLVIATQNPVEQEGTYPLSEAQTDRFMLKDLVQYPSVDDEVEVISRMDAGLYEKDHRTAPVVGADDIRRVQNLVRTVHMDRELIEYASRLVERDPRARAVSAREHRPAHRVRRQPAGDDRVLPDCARPGRSPRPQPRRARRHRPPCAPRAAAPPDPRLRGGQRAAHAGCVVDAVLAAVRVP